MAIEQHVWTSCRRGEGYDNIVGFQVKARSRGITDPQAAVIRKFCEHYRLPASAEKVQSIARSEGRDLTEQELSDFPTSVFYYPVDPEHWALTVMHYLGKDHSDRWGNFLAHTLVMLPDELAPLEHNPLALARTAAFPSRDIVDAPQAPTLESLDAYAAETAAGEVPQPGSTPADYLAQVAAAANAAPQTGRTVIIATTSWRETAAVIEGALLLLPPHRRCRTSFATHEPFPQRIVQAASFGPRNTCVQIIGTPSREEGGGFSFAPAEYTSRWVVFNFIEGKFSPDLDTPTYFARAQELARKGDDGRALAEWQDMVCGLAGEDDPSRWDALSPLAALAGDLGGASDSEIVAGLECLTTHVSAEQVSEAAAIALRVFSQVLRVGSASVLESALRAIAHISQVGDETVRSSVQTRLGQFVGTMLTEGQLAMAREIISSPGFGRELVGQALAVAVGAGWPQNGAILAKTQADREAAAFVLAEVLSVLRTSRRPVRDVLQAAVRILEAGMRLGVGTQLWRDVAAQAVPEWLSSLKDTEPQVTSELETRLVDAATAAQLAEPRLDLALWRLAQDEGQSDDAGWLATARQVAALAGLCDPPLAALQRLLDQIARRWPGGEEKHLFALAAVLEEVWDRPDLAGVVTTRHDELARTMFD